MSAKSILASGNTAFLNGLYNGGSSLSLGTLSIGPIGGPPVNLQLAGSGNLQVSGSIQPNDIMDNSDSIGTPNQILVKAGAGTEMLWSSNISPTNVTASGDIECSTLTASAGIDGGSAIIETTGEISAGTGITTTAGNIIATTGALVAGNGIQFTNAPANGVFLNMQYARFANLNPDAFAEVDAGVGTGDNAATGLVYENYRFAPAGTALTIANVRAMSFVFSTGGGTLIVNTTNVVAPSNGAAGYCNFEFVFTNTTSAGITPTEIDSLIFVTP